MLKNMKLRTRLILLAIITVILSCLPALYIKLSTEPSKENGIITVRSGYGQGGIGLAMLDLTNYHLSLRDYIGFNENDKMQTAAKAMNEAEKAYNERVASIKSELGDTEKEQYNKIQKAYSAYMLKAEYIYDIASTTDAAKSARSLRVAKKELDPLYDALYGEWEKLFASAAERAEEVSIPPREQPSANVGVVIIMVIAMAAASVVMALLISSENEKQTMKCCEAIEKIGRGELDINTEDLSDDTAAALDAAASNLKKVVSDLSTVLNKLSQGDFTADTADARLYTGEFEKILGEVRTVISNQNRIMKTISHSANQVTKEWNSSVQIDTSEQISSVRALSDTVNVLMNDVEANSENAKKAHEIADEAAAQMDKSSLSMKEMKSAMKEITEASDRIAEIIKKVEDIAFQTNILALNAAVEASQAGAAGKGFAVVADEVRMLAGKSSEAAKSTAELIEAAVSAVENGGRIADKAVSELEQAVESARLVTDRVNIIEKTSFSQENTLSQITGDIDRLEKAIENASAAVRKNADASRSLSGQAGKLNSLVGKFKLE